MSLPWPEVKLGDICEKITVGHVGPMAQEYVEDGIPFLRSQNIKPFSLALEDIKYITPAFHEKLRKSALRPGDVAIIRTGYPGIAAVIPESLPTSNCADLVIIRPGDKINAHFLASLFNSTWGQGMVSGRLVGAAQQHFNVSAAKDMHVSLPPLPTQRKIASILSAYDDLIENNTRRVRVLEDMARALYREWFVEYRFPGHEQAEFVEDEQGRRPEGWEWVPVSALASYVNGFAFKPEHWGETGWPIIKIKELKGGITASTPRCSPDVIKPMLHVQPGEILFSWSADLDAYIWPHEPGLLNQHVFRVIPNSGVERAFLFHALKATMPRFRSLSLGATMQHIKRSALDQVFTTLPTQKLQSQFASITQPIHEQVINLTQRNANLRRTRDLLLPRLVSGELDVSELEIAGVEDTQGVTEEAVA